jgi:rhodanese-related sulfurtransferase/rubrerythrin
MDLFSLFRPVPEITVDEVRDLMMGRSAASWYLLDVRQPEEYQDGHLPGAHLVELGRLHEALDTIPRDGIVVVYCRSGRRSASATAMLRHAGFEDARNLVGGVLAWRGVMVGGWPMTPLEPILDGAGVSPDHLECAALLEIGTRLFYEAVAGDARTDPETRALFEGLMAAERHHTAHLRDLWQTMTGTDGTAFDDTLAAADDRDLCIEGGASLRAAIAWLGRAELREAVEVATGSEALAWDRYRILAHRCAEPTLAAGLEKLAAEERGHMERLLSRFGELVG